MDESCFGDQDCRRSLGVDVLKIYCVNIWNPQKINKTKENIILRSKENYTYYMSLNLEGNSVSATVNSHVNDKRPEHFIAELKAKYEEHYQKHQFLQTLSGHVQYDLHGRRSVRQRSSQTILWNKLTDF